jgi:hypothetical protein
MRALRTFLVAAVLAALTSLAHAGNVSCTISSEGIAGNLYIASGSCTMSSSYATGGDLFGSGNTLAQAGQALCGSFARVPQVVLVEACKGGNLFEYDHTNRKIMAYRPLATHTPAGTNSKPAFVVDADGAIGTNMEVGFSADSDAATFEGGTGITADRTLTTTSPVGIPTFTGTAVTAAVATQVTSTTDLSTTTLRFVAFCS